MAQIERDGTGWAVTRHDAVWRFANRAEADRHAEHLDALPADARPEGWPWGADLMYDREDR